MHWRKDMQMMKKIRNIVAVSLLAAAVTSGPAFADPLVNLTGFSDEEMVQLLEDVQEEIATRHIEKTANLERGTYVVGKDIPAGDYILTRPANGESGIIWLRDVSDAEEDWPSKLYEFIQSDEAVSFFITVGDGDTLCLPFPASLTISAGLVFK